MYFSDVKILQFPLTKIGFGFLFGILLFQMIKLSLLYVIVIYLICFSGIVVSHFVFEKTRKHRHVFGYFVILTATIVGISTAMVHKETLHSNHYSHQLPNFDSEHQLHLVLLEKLKSTTKNLRFTCSVKTLDSKNSFGKVILNISKNTNQNYIIGKHLLINGFVIRNKKPFNPNLFDYGKYLENQEIYAQVYAKPNQIKIGKYEPSLWAGFSNFRNKIINNLEHSDIPKEELYVLNALILGQQQDISSEVLKDYQYAGAVHVLSVSGLHVGFILLFITFLLKPIPNSRNGSLLKLLLLVIALWSFAILAGLSPSIVRSVTMFSFLAIGLHLRRTVAVYHTLIVSILLILLFKPSFLFDVGFQLSYLALFFIIWFQPVLSQIWQPKNKIIGYFWNIITVSFAAQIGTMPLSIYYFHQFPGLFFVTNLLILPLIGVIMAVGVLVVVIAIFCPIPYYLAKIVTYLIILLNSIIHWVASLDSFVIRNISFSKEMLWDSYLVIILIIFWIKIPKFNRLIVTLSSIVVLQIIFIIQKNKTLNENELIVFYSRRNSIITERTGKKVTVYSNDSILRNIENNLLIQTYLTGNFCFAKEKKSLPNLIYFKHQRILLIDSSAIYSNRIYPDILIISQSPKLNMRRLLKTIHPKIIIADGSNFKSYTKLWKATCIKEKIPFHNTNEEGFYKL